MSSKVLFVEGIGDVTLSKRKGQRSIRISVSGTKVKVTQPSWLPFSAGEAFISTRIGWIQDHLKQSNAYIDGQQIGISHTLKLVEGIKLSRRITDHTLLVTYPRELTMSSSVVQEYVESSVQKVLRQQAESYLPRRTQQLADIFDFKFSSVKVRTLLRRWGSCNTKKEITFNVKLMELDALHIDYVILHELTHTIYMNHSSEFWSHMEQVMPNAKKIAKDVRHLQV